MDKEIRKTAEPMKNTIGAELSAIEGILQDTIKTTYQLGNQLYPVMESTDGEEDCTDEAKLPDKYLKRLQTIKGEIIALRDYIAKIKVALVI